jgi:glycosyltransferase involved in cell wall biosynthesis
LAREKKVAHRFTFLPFQQDVKAIYHDVDVVVMPSIWEASGLLAMEAMCSGTPLIASDCIGLRETVADTPAIVFPSQNVVALAEAIKVARDSDLKECFRKFMHRAQERYDVRKTALAVERLFESVVKAR